MRVSERVKDSLLLVASWLFAIAYTYTNIFPDPDFWGRLSMGALFFQNGRFPYIDVFSYTAPHARWVDHEWLTGLVFYQIMAHFGETGLLVFKCLMILGCFALLYRLHRKVYRVSGLVTFYALLLLIDAISVGLYATVRSHMFTFLFFLFELYLLERVRLGQKNRRWLWLLVPLIALWGNLHGGVAMGLLLLGCYGLGEAIAQRNLKAGGFHWLLAGASVALLSVLNPYGPSYLSFLWHAWTLDRSKIGEWTPLKLDNWAFLTGQLMVLLGGISVLLRWLFRDKQNTTGEVNRLLTPSIVWMWAILMLLRAVRMQPFLAFVMTAYLPVLFSPDFIRRVLPGKVQAFFQRNASAFNTAIPLALLSLAIGVVIFLQAKGNLFKVELSDEMNLTNAVVTRYPLGALTYLRRSPYHGNLMVHFGVGEFMLWSLYPRFKVSMDGRYEEVYSQEEFLRSHYCYSKRDRQKNWDSFKVINDSQADFVLMVADLAINVRLVQSPQWKLLYNDTYFALYGRVSSLEKLPEFKQPMGLLNSKSISIGDMFTDADLKRFKTSEY
jgi:hypothetical protein